MVSRLLAVLVVAALSLGMGKQSRPAFSHPVVLDRFFKGNTHTHSTRSDGDSKPETVIEWYRDHGYQFLVLTDHEHASLPGEFSALETPGFRVVAGEEISFDSRAGRNPRRPSSAVHVGALCSNGETVHGKKMEPVLAALKTAVAGATRTSRVAQVNHPNYEWALRFEEVRELEGTFLIEIANQHSDVRNAGDATHISTEALWDRLLSAGKTFWGVASDDMHDLVRDPGFPPRRPGLGWVQVAAAELSDVAICDALLLGRFYFSTGVEISGIAVSGDRISLGVPADSVTTFIGSGGRVLATVPGAAAKYRLLGGEGYVRARVEAGGKTAWTQAYPVSEQP